MTARTTQAALCAPFDFVPVPNGCAFTYEVCLRAGTVTHTWALRSERGAVHIWARISPPLKEWPAEWMGGVEVHYPAAPEGGWFDPAKPSQERCWLLDGKPCWHDGTSLYFSERIAPWLPHPASEMPHAMAAPHHNYAAFVLSDWFADKFTQVEETG